MAKILIVDDDHDVIDTFQFLLLNSGHDVFVAFDGEMGVEEFKSKMPDYVFMDIKMPKRDGFQAIEQILKITSKVKIFIMTAFSVGPRKKELLEKNNVVILSKPIYFDNILSLIKEPI